MFVVSSSFIPSYIVICIALVESYGSNKENLPGISIIPDHAEITFGRFTATGKQDTQECTVVY